MGFMQTGKEDIEGIGALLYRRQRYSTSFYELELEKSSTVRNAGNAVV
jgi:hypothetical protein